MADEIIQLAKDLKESREALQKQQNELQSAHREVMQALEKGSKLDPDVQKNIDEAIAKANERAEEITALSRQMDEVNKSIKLIGKSEQPETLRGLIMKAANEGSTWDDLQKMANHEGKGKVKLVISKDITTGSVDVGMKRQPHIDSLVSLERQPLRIVNLLNRVPVQSELIEYGKQTLRDNKAKIVAEQAKKPYSNYKWEKAEARVVTVAHLTKMTLQALADAPRLAAEVESEMTYGWHLAVEEEVLNGDGTTGHMDGLMNQATPWAIPSGMDSSNVLTGIDRLRIAILQIHLARAIPDAHVLNPINVAEFDLMRNAGSIQDAGYLFSRPDGDTGVLRLWRLPVVESPSMEVGEFLTGAFKYSVNLYDRQGVNVAISTENEDDFETNQATMRVEGRLGLGVRREYGLVAGALEASGS